MGISDPDALNALLDRPQSVFRDSHGKDHVAKGYSKEELVHIMDVAVCIWTRAHMELSAMDKGLFARTAEARRLMGDAIADVIRSSYKGPEGMSVIDWRKESRSKQ